MTPQRRSTITTIILAGYGVIFLLLLSFLSYFSDGMQRMQQITEKLHVHPFAVSNAAASLRGSLFQLRSHMLQMVLLKAEPLQLTVMWGEAERYDQSLRGDLAIIRQNFLGDMRQVEQLETKLDEWEKIRWRIVGHARSGDFARAEALIREEGTPKFLEIVPLVDYILGFAKNRARLFVQEGEETLTQLISHLRVGGAILVGLVATVAGLVLWRVSFLHTALDRLATTDPLTGVANRRHFLDRVRHEQQQSARRRRPCSLAVVDLDLFKRINDRYGHQTGDEALRVFCRVCQDELRGTDMLGRVGGEEFAILLPDTAADEALRVLERLRAAVARASIAAGPGQAIGMTASFGLSSFAAGLHDMDEAFRTADAALYQAKEAGRNRVVLAPTEAAA